MTVRPLAALAVFAAMAVACSSDPTPNAAPTEVGSPSRAAEPTPRTLPPGDLLAVRLGTGSTRLGTVAVDEPATLFFQCRVGSSATIKYGSGSQVCPDKNALLAVELTSDTAPLVLSVEAASGTEWAVSVARDRLR